MIKPISRAWMNDDLVFDGSAFGDGNFTIEANFTPPKSESQILAEKEEAILLDTVKATGKKEGGRL